jgi:uncharacterized membrane protein
MSTVVGIFNERSQAERAVNEIREAGITDDKISIAAKEDQLRGEGNEDNEGAMGRNVATGATTGGSLGGLTGLLAGAGALAIPGVGPILAAGPIAAGLSGAAAGGVAGSLVDLGVPNEQGQEYEEEIKRGGLLAVVEADNNKVNDVASFMRRNGAKNVKTH